MEAGGACSDRGLRGTGRREQTLPPVQLLGAPAEKRVGSVVGTASCFPGCATIDWAPVSCLILLVCLHKKHISQMFSINGVSLAYR